MLELKFKNVIPSLLVFIAGVIAAFGSAYINVSLINIPIPLIITGLFAVCLVLNFISYSKASTSQIIQLTITGFFINIAILIAAIYALNYFGIVNSTVDSDFIIFINPLILLTSSVVGFITLISTARLEEKDSVHEQSQTEKLVHVDAKPSNEEPETISFSENKITETPVEEKRIVLEKIPELPGENSALDYKDLFPKTEIEQKEEFIELEKLPEINLNEDFEPNNKPEKNTEPTEEEYFDFIPTDIRLVESPVSKDNETKGKIGSIGKLLVNNRDIEDFIESATESGTEGKTSVVSSVSGEQIYEKFSRLKQEFTHIKEIALIDKGGFIIAGNFADERAIHIAGALVAGIYHTLQNYLAQLSFKQPQKIFFETENSNSFIIKTGDEFLFSNWDKEFKHVECDLPENLAEIDLTPFVDLAQIKRFAAFDESGKLTGTTNNSSENEKLAIISSALFENLKVFLMNIQLIKLSKITVFSTEEILTIQKLDSGFISFLTPIDGMVKISDNFAKMEQIY